MSGHKSELQKGFTLVEILVVVSLSAVVMISLYTFFQSSFRSYLGLQKDASGLTDLTSQSQRIAKVMRGATNIETIAANDITFYAYFAPTDAYVSKVRYYLSADSTKLHVDVTPMTANPPTGTLITADKRTYTVLDNFRQSAGVNLFSYMNAAGSPMTLPISDLNTIKGIKVSLATDVTNNDTNQVIAVQVSLRNRKTNL
jgi:prepilin-type N-terminal cleavage/methylation domain-containing protein